MSLKNFVEEARDYARRGDEEKSKDRYREALVWYDAGVRCAKAAAATDRSQVATYIQLLLKTAECHDKRGDSLGILKAATQVLDLDDRNLTAMYLRAKAFSSPSIWQSRLRFLAELHMMTTIDPNSTLSRLAHDSLPIPLASSDDTFGGVNIGAEKEGKEEDQAAQRQRILVQAMIKAFSKHVPIYEREGVQKETQGAEKPERDNQVGTGLKKSQADHHDKSEQEGKSSRGNHDRCRGWLSWLWGSR